MLNLKIEKRDIKTNLDELRRSGNIPAVFYGKGVESTPILVSEVDFKKVWKEAGSSSLVTLSGVDGNKDVVIQDIDVNPATGKINNVDFYVVQKDKLMEAEVPLEFVGIAPAVKTFGGILVKVMHSLNIEVLPKDLPHSITVDVSSLENLDSVIAIKDLVIPAGVKITDDVNEVVVAISTATEEKETASADISTIEVQKKGKKEVEE